MSLIFGPAAHSNRGHCFGGFLQNVGYFDVFGKISLDVGKNNFHLQLKKDVHISRVVNIFIYLNKLQAYILVLMKTYLVP